MDGGTMQGVSVIPDAGVLALKSGAMLLVVLAVLLLCVWLLKRVGNMSRLAVQGALRVRGTYHLGPKERVMLVDVEGIRLLLGVTPSGIQTLHTFGPAPETLDAEPVSPSFFETLFKGELGKKTELGKRTGQKKEGDHGEI